mgnify:FL=1
MSSNYSVSVVGMGRSGTTLVSEIIEHANGKCGYYHWKKDRGDMSNKKDDNEYWIICRRDLRDILASGFRNTIQRNRLKKISGFRVSEDNPLPRGYKKFKVEEHGSTDFFVKKSEILSHGNQIMYDGWVDWIDKVDYIFHYERYIENREEVVEEILSNIGATNVTAEYCISVVDEWIKNNPKHASNKGVINGWGDIFSP